MSGLTRLATLELPKFATSWWRLRPTPLHCRQQLHAHGLWCTHMKTPNPSATAGLGPQIPCRSARGTIHGENQRGILNPRHSGEPTGQLQSPNWPQNRLPQSIHLLRQPLARRSRRAWPRPVPHRTETSIVLRLCLKLVPSATMGVLFPTFAQQRMRRRHTPSSSLMRITLRAMKWRTSIHSRLPSVPQPGPDLQERERNLSRCVGFRGLNASWPREGLRRWRCRHEQPGQLMEFLTQYHQEYDRTGHHEARDPP